MRQAPTIDAFETVREVLLRSGKIRNGTGHVARRHEGFAFL